jgi:glycosyltransferase involved in cell wall biosynthesis
MPTLLQISVEGDTGPIGRIAESIGRLAIQRGWDSYIANGRNTRPSKSRLIRIGSDGDVLMHGLQTRLFDRHCLGSKRATQKLIKQIININPNVIQLHHLHGYYINIEILFNFLSKASIPIVWTFHDCWSITGHCAYFDSIGCNKWKEECNNCPQRKEYPTSLFYDRSKKNYHLKKALFTSVEKMTIVPVSNWLRDIVRDSFMGDIPMKVIYNGINTEIFTPQVNQLEIREKLNIGKKFMMLGVASPWSPRKGLNDFVKLSKVIGDNDVIILVGLNKKEVKELPPNIIGLYKTENQKQLKDLYAAADLYLNLSVEETFGLTTVEALSCGTPALVYNSTACPEVLGADPHTGFVIGKGDTNGILRAIETVKKYGKQHYVEACRKRAVELYDQNDRFNEYLNLYEKLIKEK